MRATRQKEGRYGESRAVDAWRSQRCRGSSGLVRQHDCIWRESSVRGASRRQRDADSTDGGCSLAQALKCGLSASRTSTPPGRAFLIGGRACVLVQAAAAPCLPPRLPLVANHERTPHRRARESVSSASRKMDPAFSPIPVFWDQNPRISTSGRFSRSDAKNGLKLCQGAHGQPAAACPTGVPVVLALRG